MTGMPIYQALAEAFHAEGVRRVFTLTGDGNMHWEAALATLPGVQSIHARHEHAACAMATAWARATGEVGIASVTCGPGLSQIMTALATAAQARLPLVVFTGEDPMHASWYNQRIDQAPLVTATGAEYIAARSARRIPDAVLTAFATARRDRRPVVLAVPLDLQREPALPAAYVPSHRLLPAPLPRPPHPADLAAAIDRIRAARRILVLAGLGAIEGGAMGRPPGPDGWLPGAAAACIRLAEMTGGALATTLPARGLFEGHPRNLGVCGGYAHAAVRPVLAAADLVIAVGTSLSRFVSDTGKQFTPDRVLQIDHDPTLPRHGQVPASGFVIGDSRLAVEALVAALEGDAPRAPDPGWDVAQAARRLGRDCADPVGDRATDALDPRAVMEALTLHADPSWAHVSSSGHCAFYGAQLFGRRAGDFLTIRDFGAIGNGLSYAVGRWAARPEQPVLLTDGDGSFLMHVQELETVRRHGMPLLMCILNDGAYGSEVHKLRADGVPEHGAIFGRGDLASIARGFGIEGHRVSGIDQIADLARRFAADPRPTLWDVHISDKVVSPPMRKIIGAG